MEDLQEALRCRAHSMQQGICSTEQCLQLLASVQDTVRQEQQAQVQAIQANYQKQLQDLTEAFEQQVLELQQQTHAQLADLQLAAEDALHQAAQAVLEELQLDSPVAHLPTATPGGLTKPGSPASSEMVLELSLAALQQQHADTGQPQDDAAACQQLVSTDKQREVRQQQSSHRVASNSTKPCAAHAAPAQHKAPGDMRPNLDAPDTCCSLQHEDQAEQQERHVPANWLQQQEQQEQLPQPSSCWLQHPAAQPVAQRAVRPPAGMPSIGRSPSGSAAAGSPQEAPVAKDSLEQGPWQRRPGSSSSSSSLFGPAGAPTERLARQSTASLHQGAALVKPTPCPRMLPWQPAPGQNQGAVQQGVLGRQLRAVVSLPARQQAVSQPLTTRRASATTAADHAASAVLRRAPSLRQQLEAGWQQGLAKAAGKAADTSSTGILQTGVVSRRGSHTTGVTINDSSSDESSGDEGGSAGQQRRSIEVKRWSSLLQHSGAPRGARASYAHSLAPAGRKQGAGLARSSSAQQHRAGSKALDLLWE